MSDDELVKKIEEISVEVSEYFLEDMEGMIKNTRIAITQGNSGFILLMVSNALFLRSLTHIHVEYLNMIRDHFKKGGTMDSFMETSNEETLERSLKAYLSKSKAA